MSEEDGGDFNPFGEKKVVIHKSGEVEKSGARKAAEGAAHGCGVALLVMAAFVGFLFLTCTMGAR